MSDIFEFRVWDKMERKMYYDVNWVYGFYGDPDIDDLNEGRIQVVDKEGNLVRQLPMYEDEFEFMQCIGLMDNEDNRIFQYDIISFDDRQVGGTQGEGIVFFCTDMTLVNAPCFCLDTKEGILPQFPFNNKIEGNIFEDEDVLPESEFERKKFLIYRS